MGVGTCMDVCVHTLYACAWACCLQKEPSRFQQTPVPNRISPCVVSMIWPPSRKPAHGAEARVCNFGGRSLARQRGRLRGRNVDARERIPRRGQRANGCAGGCDGGCVSLGVPLGAFGASRLGHSIPSANQFLLLCHWTLTSQTARHREVVPDIDRVVVGHPSHDDEITIRREGARRQVGGLPLVARRSDPELRLRAIPTHQAVPFLRDGTGG